MQYRERVALYLRIAEALREDIARGRWVIGERLPTIADLQQQWAVHGIQTVRSAYLILIEEGLVEARHGTGYFLRRIPPTRIDQITEQLLSTVQRELLRAAITTGVTLRGLGSHLPDGLRDAHESTLAWVADELGPGATQTVQRWVLRGDVPVYRDKAGSHALRADQTFALVQTQAGVQTRAGVQT